MAKSNKASKAKTLKSAKKPKPARAKAVKPAKTVKAVKPAKARALLNKKSKKSKNAKAAKPTLAPRKTSVTKAAIKAKSNGAQLKKGKGADKSESAAVLGKLNQRRMASRRHLSPFLHKQRDRLLQLRDGMLDSMQGVAKDNLRSRAEGSEVSAFGMHQADAGSDAYDRDFALSLLSQEQDALYEIDEALKRIDGGNYGICEMSGKPIPHTRLEAIPFTRFTVECQSQLEKQQKMTRTRQPVTSLFGLTDEESAETEEEETPADNKE